jgi:hypothetical protein
MDEQKAEQHKLDHAEAPLATMPAVNQVHADETDLVLHGKYGTTAIDDEDIKLVSHVQFFLRDLGPTILRRPSKPT